MSEIIDGFTGPTTALRVDYANCRNNQSKEESRASPTAVSRFDDDGIQHPSRATANKPSSVPRPVLRTLNDDFVDPAVPLDLIRQASDDIFMPKTVRCSNELHQVSGINKNNPTSFPRVKMEENEEEGCAYGNIGDGSSLSFCGPGSECGNFGTTALYEKHSTDIPPPSWFPPFKRCKLEEQEVHPLSCCHQERTMNRNTFVNEYGGLSLFGDDEYWGPFFPLDQDEFLKNGNMETPKSPPPAINGDISEHSNGDTPQEKHSGAVQAEKNLHYSGEENDKPSARIANAKKEQQGTTTNGRKNSPPKKRKLQSSSSSPSRRKKQTRKGKKEKSTAVRQKGEAKRHSKNSKTADDEETIRDGPKFRIYQAKNWSLRFKEVKDFVDKFGHCIIPHDFPPNQNLARWAKRQRYQYKLFMNKSGKSSMTTQRIEALEKLDFCWDVHKALWSCRYEELKNYVAEYGNANVPTGFKKNKQLATWVKCQRRQYKLREAGHPANIDETRIGLLERVGFQWDLTGGRQPK